MFWVIPYRVHGFQQQNFLLFNCTKFSSYCESDHSLLLALQLRQKCFFGKYLTLVNAYQKM